MLTRIIVTSDGARLTTGDRAFNYYDMKPGTIGPIDERAQPDTMIGQNSSTPQEEWSNHWFEFVHDDCSANMLDGSRICTIAFARRKGWM